MADFRMRTWIMQRTPVTPRIIDEEINPSSGWTDNPNFHCLLVDLPGFGKDDIKFNVNESGIIVVSGRKQIGEEKQVHFHKTFSVPENGDVKNFDMRFEGDTLRVVIPKEKKDTPENMNKASISSDNDTKIESNSPPSDDDSKEKETDKEEADSSSDNMEEKKDICEREEKKEEPECHKEDEEETREKLREYEKEQYDGKEEKKSSGQLEQGLQKTVIVKIIENRGILLASIISFTLGLLFSQKFNTSSPK